MTLAAESSPVARPAGATPPLPPRSAPADGAREASHLATGCLVMTIFVALPALVYFGFFAFAIVNSILDLGMLEWIGDGPLADFLEIIYWPLIVIVEKLEIV